jgi:UDP-2,3-diacylglucosamine pyrophosphatase LpxH
MHDIVVVSDLHLGRGKNPATGRFYELEAFFYDEDFRSFCQWLIDDAARRNAAVRLVLNGDTFDLLRIDRPPQ